MAKKPAFEPGKASGAARSVVRLTEGAVGDLERMLRKGDPQVVRWALKKMLLLERDPEAGEPLLGGLIGWRKIVVGDRDWRVVWRVGHDSSGHVVVDVAEVWAFGARSDAEVYDEVASRLAESRSPSVSSLAEVLQLLGKVGAGLAAAPEVAEEPVVPGWLREVLVKVVGLSPAVVEALSLADAERAWADYQSGTR